MMRRLIVEATIEADIIATQAWLRERSPAAALRFARAVKNSLLLIGQNPHQYQAYLAVTAERWCGHFPMG